MFCLFEQTISSTREAKININIRFSMMVYNILGGQKLTFFLIFKRIHQRTINITNEDTAIINQLLETFVFMLFQLMPKNIGLSGVLLYCNTRGLSFSTFPATTVFSFSFGELLTARTHAFKTIHFWTPIFILRVPTTIGFFFKRQILL